MIKMNVSCVSHDMIAPLAAMTSMVDNIINSEEIDGRIVKLLQPVYCTSKILKV